MFALISGFLVSANITLSLNNRVGNAPRAARWARG
jgi:hypothetical protein